ncbi:MAG: Na+/H+ antiporter NhaC family protein, partial [Myxococcota bacterium]|nr:Na+/H+ antiporter NhaC family protein [Myxococcota bacterium]
TQALKTAISELDPTPQTSVPATMNCAGPARACAIAQTVAFENKSIKLASGDGYISAFKPPQSGRIAPALVLAIEPVEATDSFTIRGNFGEKEYTKTGIAMANWLALVPPMLALVIALAFHRVVLALFLAVLSGGIIMRSGDVLSTLWIEAKSIVGGALNHLNLYSIKADGYIGSVIADTFNLQILGFTFTLVGLVAVISRMGGTRGLVNALSIFARGPRSAQAVTSLMGTAVFFDDYANTVVVGTTARSLTDRYRISREKLAYIVDSTSAPIAGLAIISTWIGYEVGLFDSLMGTLAQVDGLPDNGYEFFFVSLPYRFYCVFALALVFLGAWLSRDLGSMYQAEVRARRGGPLVMNHTETADEAPTALEKPGVTPRAINAVLPIAAVLIGILGSIYVIGTGQHPSISLADLSDWKLLFDAGGASIGSILFGAAGGGVVVAFILAATQRLLTPVEMVGAFFSGMRTLFEAAAILVLAWAIKKVCEDVGTGNYIVALIGADFPSTLLPVLIFALSGIVAFSTGTSWGTMALVLPISASLSVTLSDNPFIVMACMAAVLDGAIWGDHCSPISDTTILSSTATGCPHIDHVRTQLPYAMLAMLAAGLAGYLGVGLGLSTWLSYGFGFSLLVAGLLLFGRNPNTGIAPQPSAERR